MNMVTVIGMDLGDKFHTTCALDDAGVVVDKATVPATRQGLEDYFTAFEPTCVALEAGTHSPWVSRALQQWGHDVIVANPRQLPLIYRSAKKCDERDAEMLARLARSDAQLLCPLHHRSAQAQTDRAFLRARDALVKARTMLINHARGLVKSFGERLPKCSAPSFARQVADHVPEPLRPALEPTLATIGDLTSRIKVYDRKIEQMCAERYSETERLRQIPGVGALTALTYVLTIEEPERFARRQSLGAFTGLAPRRDQSGDVDKQLRITKAGDGMLRRYLVSAAHYIMGPFGPPSRLREFGERLAARGGKNAKKRAVVAVARKLSIVLHRLWVTGERYEPFPKPVKRRGRNARRR